MTISTRKPALRLLPYVIAAALLSSPVSSAAIQGDCPTGGCTTATGTQPQIMRTATDIPFDGSDSGSGTHNNTDPESDGTGLAPRPRDPLAMCDVIPGYPSLCWGDSIQDVIEKVGPGQIESAKRLTRMMYTLRDPKVFGIMDSDAYLYFSDDTLTNFEYNYNKETKTSPQACYDIYRGVENLFVSRYDKPDAEIDNVDKTAKKRTVSKSWATQKYSVMVAALIDTNYCNIRIAFVSPIPAHRTLKKQVIDELLKK